MATERKPRSGEVGTQGLPPEEREERDRQAFEWLERHAKEMRARYGPDTSNSVDIIRQMRQDRTRQLMERSGDIPVGDDEAWARVLERDREIWEAGGRWAEGEQRAREKREQIARDRAAREQAKREQAEAERQA